jgi:hypothetical protein
MLDNGAFSAWKRGHQVDWSAYYAWVEPWLDYWTTWAVIPDVITGTEAGQDELIQAWPFGERGAPVWHMHEPIDRLQRLCDRWPRVCLGSSGDYATVGDSRWHCRMHDAMDAVCGNGPAPVWLHMLRGGNLAGSDYPFASVDSTNVAQNHSGNNTRRTPPRDIVTMAIEKDAWQCPPRWRMRLPQPQLDHEAAA